MGPGVGADLEGVLHHAAKQFGTDHPILLGRADVSAGLIRQTVENLLTPSLLGLEGFLDPEIGGVAVLLIRHRQEGPEAVEFPYSRPPPATHQLTERRNPVVSR